MAAVKNRPADEADEGDLRYAEPRPEPPRGMQKPRASWQEDDFDRTTDTPGLRGTGRIGIPVVQGRSEPSAPLSIKATEEDTLGQQAA